MQEITELTISRIIDYSFRNSIKSILPVTLFSLVAAIAYAISSLPIILVSSFSSLDYGDYFSENGLVVIITAILAAVVSVFYFGTLLQYATKFYLNKEYSIMKAFNDAKNNFWKGFLLIFFIVIYLAILFVITAIIVNPIANISSISSGLEYFYTADEIFQSEIVAIIVLGIMFLATLFVVFSPSIILEKGIGPFKAIINSISLVGKNFFRVLIHGVIAVVMNLILATILASICLGIISFFTTIIGFNSYNAITYILYGVVYFILFSIFINIVLTHISILYYDIKVRKEGWAIEELINNLESEEQQN